MKHKHIDGLCKHAKVDKSWSVNHYLLPINSKVYIVLNGMTVRVQKSMLIGPRYTQMSKGPELKRRTYCIRCNQKSLFDILLLAINTLKFWYDSISLRHNVKITALSVEDKWRHPIPSNPDPYLRNRKLNIVGRERGGRERERELMTEESISNESSTPTTITASTGVGSKNVNKIKAK